MFDQRKLALSLLLVFLVACGRMRQAPANDNPLSRSASPADTREAALITARITHLDGRQPLDPGSLVVPNTADVEGEIDGRPLGSDIYVAARVPGGPWNLRPAPASIMAPGRFRSLGGPLIPGTSAAARSCQVIAVVLTGPPPGLVLDDASLVTIAEKISRPVNVQIEADNQQATSEKLAITAIRDQPITVNEPVIVPLNLSLQGTSGAEMDGKEIRAAVRDAKGMWTVLDPPAIAVWNEWQIPSLTLPVWTIRQSNATQLMITASDSAPPQGPQPLARVEKWSTRRSSPIQVLVQPISLSIESLVDAQGREFTFGDRSGHAEDVVSLSSDSARISILSDNPSSEASVSLLVRPEGYDLWLAFGPATLVSPGQWDISGAKLNLSGHGRWSHCTIRAVASNERLNGRALSDDEIQQVAIGSSIPRTISFDPPAPDRKLDNAETIELTSNQGQSLDKLPESLDVTDGVDIRGIANLLPDSTLAAGVRCAGSQFWEFQPVQVAKNGAFRVLSLPAPDCPHYGSGVEAEFQLVAAKVPLSGFAQDKWRMPFTVSDSGAPVPLIVSHWPWLLAVRDRLIGPTPAKPAESLAGFAPQNDAFGGTLMNGIGSVLPWIIVASLLLVLYLLRNHWHRLQMSSWVWLNTLLDARAGRPAADSNGLGPFESRVIAHYNCRILRGTQKPLARIAELLGRSAAYDVPRPVISKTWHYILLALFFLGDTAFNLSAFNVFREPMLYTLLMALPVGIGIPVCAVFVGVRAVSFNTKKRENAIIIGLLLIAVGACLYGINVARITFLRYHNPEYLQENPGLGTAFFVLTIFIFVATAVTTVLAHVHLEDKTQAAATAQIQKSRADKHRGKIEKEKTKIRGWAKAQQAEAIELIYKYRTSIARRNQHLPRYFTDEAAPANHWKFVDCEQLIAQLCEEPPAHRAPTQPPSRDAAAKEGPSAGNENLPGAYQQIESDKHETKHGSNGAPA